jgi:DNA-binding NarL/FixJ family response regulator
MIVQGLRDTVTADDRLHCVGQVANGQQAVEAYGRLRPDIVVLDLQMPVLDGFEATKQIRAIDPSARVISFTCLDGEEDVRRAVQAGVTGYLLKTASVSDVVTCIRSVASGRTYYAVEIGRQLASWVASDALSDRELQILRLVAEGHCNKTIARAKQITEGTTKSHLKHIFRKLGVSSRTAAVHAAMKRGVVRLA